MQFRAAPMPAILFLPGCRTAAPAVTGTATFRERMALPKESAFEVASLDVSPADGKTKLKDLLLKRVGDGAAAGTAASDSR